MPIRTLRPGPITVAAALFLRRPSGHSVGGRDAAAAGPMSARRSCAGCHGEIAGRWKGSDHALAWTLPSAETVLGDFADATFEKDGVVTRFIRRGDAFVVETEGADGARQSFDVVGVAGIRPLQQYLLEPEPGRTQALDIAWDTERRRWYDLYPGQRLPPGRRPALDRPLQELGGALRRVPRHRVHPQLRRRRPGATRRAWPRSAWAARPATAPARRMPPGPRRRTATTRRGGRA